MTSTKESCDDFRVSSNLGADPYIELLKKVLRGTLDSDNVEYQRVQFRMGSWQAHVYNPIAKPRRSVFGRWASRLLTDLHTSWS